MNERNMLYSGLQIHDLTNGQQVQSNINPEPCILLGNSPNFPPSRINQVLPPIGNVNGYDLHHLPEHVGRPAFYGTTQYNQPNHPTTNLELGVTSASNFFNPHLNQTSGARVFPVPLGHGFIDHSASSSNYRANAVPFNDYGRSSFSTEGVRGIFKRKNAEGMPENDHNFDSSAGPSSSSAAPISSCHFDCGPSAMDNTELALPEYRCNDASSMMEIGSGIIARHRSGTVGLHMGSVMLHNYNYLPQGNYGNQLFPPSSCTWLDQQAINSASGLPWNGPLLLPYFQGNNTQASSSELGNAGLSGYLEAYTNHGSANFLRSPSILQPHRNLHPSQNIQGVRGFGVTCYPPFMSGPARVPTNNGVQHDAISLSPESAELATRPTGFRIYRSHGRGLLPDAASRRRDLPHLRNLPVEGVAFLEFPGYGVEYDDLVDHHRDMRMDIDDMSYEELLALSERIGTVSTGLSKDDITLLKTRRYSSPAATFNLEELPCIDQNNESCIICQDEYDNNDQLATLECGHEYHADCLKKWLLVKNVCPICKSSALTVGQKDR